MEADKTTNEPQIINPNLGIDDETRDTVVEILNTLLADEYVLYTKLRKYHWNVTGPHFLELHETFEEQYTAVAIYVDELAERIRQFGPFAPGTLEEFKNLARLTEEPGSNPSGRTMVANIVDDHEAMVRALREDIEKIDDVDEDGTEDLLIGLLQKHQKQAWMLRAMLEGGAF